MGVKSRGVQRNIWKSKIKDWGSNTSHGFEIVLLIYIVFPFTWAHPICVCLAMIM